MEENQTQETQVKETVSKPERSQQQSEHIPMSRFREVLAERDALIEEVNKYKGQIGKFETDFKEVSSYKDKYTQLESKYTSEKSLSKMGITDPEDQDLIHIFYGKQDFGDEKVSVEEYVTAMRSDPEKMPKALKPILLTEETKTTKKGSPWKPEKKMTEPQGRGSNTTPNFSNAKTPQDLVKTWEAFKKQQS